MEIKKVQNEVDKSYYEPIKIYPEAITSWILIAISMIIAIGILVKK